MSQVAGSLRCIILNKSYLSITSPLLDEVLVLAAGVVVLAVFWASAVFILPKKQAIVSKSK
jgi:hypothetical protein